MVGRPDVVQCPVEVVAKSLSRLFFNHCLVPGGTGQKYGKSRCLRSFDAFRVIMGYYRGAGRLMQDIVTAFKRSADGADPHGGPVSPTVIGFGIV